MFSEVLKIVPRIDKAALAVMESTLTKRFMRVADRFGKGLEKVLKGNLLFFSLGFVTQLLNPLEKVHDRIKDLLGQGADIGDLADRFNTTPGTVKRLQALGQSKGLEPDRLNELMNRFADTIEKAREELTNPFQEPSAVSRTVSEFVDEKDLAKSFFQFIRSLQAQAQSTSILEVDRRTGAVINAEEREELDRRGLIDRVTGAEVADNIAKQVFGEIQRGAAKRFINSDFIRDFERLGIKPSAIEAGQQFDFDTSDGPVDVGMLNELDKGLKNLIARQRQNELQSTRNELKDFIVSSQLVTEDVIRGIGEADLRERAMEISQLTKIDQYQDTAERLNELTKVLQKVSDMALEFIAWGSSYLPQILSQLTSLKETLLKLGDSRLFKSFLK